MAAMRNFLPIDCFRVANLVVSPWARRGYVSHEQFDHTSVLKMIENAFGLAPLTVRDATANDLAHVLDFDRHDDEAPAIPVAPGPYGGACGTAGALPSGDLGRLYSLAVAAGYPVYLR